MATPDRRNQKKTTRRKATGHTVRQRRFLLNNPIDEPRPSFEEWLLEKRNPGDWLENEYLDEPTFEERIFRQPMSFLDRPRSFLDMDVDDDYNPDIGNDFDDLYTPSDYDGEW
ncbi:hypothetical protein ACFLTW_04595 [Chloroflexota bacterium]